MNKYCGGCRTSRSVTDFNKNRRSKDGLQDRCRDCSKRYSKHWRFDHPTYHEEYLQKRAASLRPLTN